MKLKENKEVIPTGIDFIDDIMNGGLGKSEVGIITSTTGSGKTSLLTKFANTAYLNYRKVLQVVLEDTESNIIRKHKSMLSDLKLFTLTDIVKFIDKRGGKLIIKKFNYDDLSINILKDWIIKYQNKSGCKFDIIILDNLDSIKLDNNNLSVIKLFEEMAIEFNIPCWSAIQSNRDGLNYRKIDSDFLIELRKTLDKNERNILELNFKESKYNQDGERYNGYIYLDEIIKNKLK